MAKVSNIINNKLKSKEYSKKLNNIIIDKTYDEFIAREILEEIEASDKISV